MSFDLKNIPAVRLVPGLVLAVSLGALALAYGSQYWGGLAPCVLCLYQRAAYGAVILFATAALACAFLLYLLYASDAEDELGVGGRGVL